jgi:hypothetical protein
MGPGSTLGEGLARARAEPAFVAQSGLARRRLGAFLVEAVVTGVGLSRGPAILDQLGQMRVLHEYMLKP